MALVTVDLPRPEIIACVDSRDLLSLEDAELDPVTGLPRQLRAFVVLKDPKVVVVPYFFSDEECSQLIHLAQGGWNPSMVGQATNSSEEDYGKGNLENALAPTRTSWSCMLRYAQTTVVERLEHRLANLAGLSLEQFERMNMVRYAPGELFDEHHDGKFRPMTIFVYLNDLDEKEEAGDTYFPVLGMSFRPRRGTAVMWSNITAEGASEDSRMLHSGRAPSTGIKYGVNCFFNVSNMRNMVPVGPDYDPADAAVVNVSELGGGEKSDTPKLVAFRLFRDPNVLAVPGFLTQEEVDYFLSSIPMTASATSSGTDTLHLFELEETPMVHSVEARLATTAGLGLEFLAPLRVVSCASERGDCNRGCGPKSVYICLSDQDEVFFYRLGLRLQLSRGDALMWPNVDWSTEKPVEDLRTIRVHQPNAIGIDAFFHDAAIREQQKARKFMTEEEAAAVTAPR